MTHGGNNKGIIMRRPDGTPMSRSEVIIQRRGALIWLPVLFSNDLVHGSWWFVIGSACTMLFSMYPLIQKYDGGYDHNDDVLPATDYDVTWALMIISGFFFTLGSMAFVRAFEEPPKRPLFHDYKHFQSDELLGAWLFLLGTAPAIPYMFLFFIFKPSAFFFFGTVAAIVFTYATYLFVAACYPSDKVHKNFVLPTMIKLFGSQLWVIKHLANDWLAGTWFFLWANAIAAFVSLVILFISFALGDAAQIFIWLSGTVSAVLFLVGSAYFVSGSYPHAQQFYYAEGRGHIERDPAFVDMNPEDGDEEVGDTANLLPSAKKPVKKPAAAPATHNAPSQTPSKRAESKDKPSSARSDMPTEKKEKKPAGAPAVANAPTTATPQAPAAAAAAATQHGAAPAVAVERKRINQPNKSSEAVSKAALSPSSSSAALADHEDSLPPPPPPTIPPAIVPDENQEDDDDDVDVVEENSAILHRSHMTAADLVEKQHRRRSTGLGVHGAYDALSSNEPSPEKAPLEEPVAPPTSKNDSNNNKNKQRNEKNTTKAPAADTKGKNAASPTRSIPEKPMRRPQGPPPSPPTF